METNCKKKPIYSSTSKIYSSNSELNLIMSAVVFFSLSYFFPVAHLRLMESNGILGIISSLWQQLKLTTNI